MEIVNLKMIDFDIKVENENDKRIISDIIQTSVRVYSALIARNDFIEFLFYLKRMDNIYLLAIVF